MSKTENELKKASCIVAWILGVVAVLPSIGQAVQNNEQDQKTVDFLKQTIKKHELTGVVCCVIKNGKVITSGAAGVRKIGEPQLLTVKDQVHLGSCTKAMTATLVAQLVEEKKMKWDTKLLEVFPNLEKELHQDYHKVTVTDLLTHQSGVPKNNVGGWPYGKPVRTLRFELIKRSLTPKPEQPVGEYYYSNLGYITAGAMVEKVTNQKWEDLIRKKLFDKLGMESAGFGPPGANSKNPASKPNSRKIDQPWGHVKDLQGKWKPIRHDNPPILGPAGTVHCSILDWAKFVSLHISWKNRKPKILSPKALEYLQTPVSKTGYSYGWFSVPRRWGKGRVISHNGSNTYWMANVWAAPNTDFAVLSVTNCCRDDVAKALDAVASEMINRFAQ